MTETIQTNERATSNELLEKMKKDPDECFENPREVLQLQDISNEDKKIILANWLDYIDHLSESEEEGMGQPFPEVHKLSSIIQEIQKAMGSL